MGRFRGGVGKMFGIIRPITTDSVYGISMMHRALQLLQEAKTPAQIALIYYELPYCLQEIEGCYLPLNRNYKPLGLPVGSTFVDYSNYKFLSIPKVLITTDHLIEGKWFWEDTTSPRVTGKRKMDYLNNLSKSLGFINAE